jgi:glycosyltransferase involved in cell wall biosynthesis
VTRRLTQLVTQLEPAGAQTVAHWLDSRLQGEATVTTVFLYDKSGSDLFPAPTLVAPSRPSNPREALLFVRGLGRLRRSARGSVVLAHTHYSIALAVLMWGHRSDTPVVAVHHWPIPRYPLVARLLIRFGRWRSLFSEEVYVNSAVADTPTAVVVPNPVPGRGPYEPVAIADPDIVIVARHAREKSIDTAIRAMASLPDRRLTLVGGGPLTARLVDLANGLGLSDRVLFAGRLSNAQVRTLMRSCRVFLLPSTWEAMPMALLEAVSEGAPIVVSDILAHQFLIEEGAAIPFATEDPEALAAAVESAENVSVREALSAGRELVRSLYGQESILRKWQSVLDPALESLDVSAQPIGTTVA